MNDAQPIAFFCTRCGAGLRVASDLAGQRVRCPQCATAVHAPHAQDSIPIADFAVPQTGLGWAERSSGEENSAELLETLDAPGGANRPLSEDDAAALLQTLDYASGPPARKPLREGESLDVLAERLTRVHLPAAGDESAMTECPFCGSTIAPYVGRCPFCRHPLHGS